MTEEPGLERFLAAQENTYDQALAELRAGRKRSHWMWFVLPQLRGLGRSPTSEFYGLRDLAEAVAYLGHPVLGERLRACVAALLALPNDSPSAVLGATDALKLRSSLTLFAAAAREAGREDDAALFARALARFYGGEPCPLTLARIAVDRPSPPRP